MKHINTIRAFAIAVMSFAPSIVFSSDVDGADGESLFAQACMLVESDLRKAIDLTRKSIVCGYEDAQYFLPGFLNTYGCNLYESIAKSDGSVDLEKLNESIVLFRESLALGYGSAQDNFVSAINCYVSHTLKDEKWSNLVPLLETSYLLAPTERTKGFLATALNNQGCEYLFGLHGVEIDLNKAKELLSKSGNLGSVDAEQHYYAVLINTAVACMNGTHGFSENIDRALNILTQLCNPELRSSMKPEYADYIVRNHAKATEKKKGLPDAAAIRGEPIVPAILTLQPAHLG